LSEIGRDARQDRRTDHGADQADHAPKDEDNADSHRVCKLSTWPDWRRMASSACEIVQHTDSRYADRLNLGLQEHVTKSQNGTSSSVIP